MKQTFLLPWPVSVNAIWRAYKGRNILAAKARTWLKNAEAELILQKPKPVAGPVALSISLCSPTKHTFDISNRVKQLEDLLVRCGIIEADDCRIVKKLTVEVGEGFVGARVTIEPIGEIA